MTTCVNILKASRPISWVNTAFPFGLAYLLAGGQVDLLFFGGVFFFLIPYNIAMYGINDVFDYESDIRNPRKGGVEGAILARSMHKPLLIASVVSTVPFLIWFFLVGTFTSGAWLALSVGAVVAYSAPPMRFKERPVLDSITSSAHFTTPALVGLTIEHPDFPPTYWLPILSFFFWGMASHALGAVQDVKADREGNLHSIATALGPRLTTRLAGLFYLVAAVMLFALPFPGWLIGVCGLGYVANTARFFFITDETCEEVNKAWRVFLVMNYFTGMIVTFAVISLYY
ncbi:prenyltransferase [Corynebacterium sp. ES2794-CONJ1]|uniref:prenyltransferase n=1 Tax=unclassified Corynebacterium TaxID=2624378 RepID=UPI0021694E4E|nr:MULTISPECIES: prenyltransferase [unclassified Corynebacterium]MCS4490568.1 prenyltransferase [Corynebacterium sp. ES2775-CONJ]MCS4492347.1 prenyltransferase [Corynebacterium sp. ES2715-CONJ3]MCS4532461.1 prenyltransferase [Corynebacterium sp. ES2730-CONJ]MCU9519856.1 prenyltransferase [Corynebacterium sp. ES2794-CONJ1]